MTIFVYIAKVLAGKEEEMTTKFVSLKTVDSATPDTIQRLKAALPGVVKTETIFPDASDLELAHLYMLSVDEDLLDETLASLNQDEEVEYAYVPPPRKLMR